MLNFKILQLVDTSNRIITAIIAACTWKSNINLSKTEKQPVLRHKLLTVFSSIIINSFNVALAGKFNNNMTCLGWLAKQEELVGNHDIASKISLHLLGIWALNNVLPLQITTVVCN